MNIKKSSFLLFNKIFRGVFLIAFLLWAAPSVAAFGQDEDPTAKTPLLSQQPRVQATMQQVLDAVDVLVKHVEATQVTNKNYKTGREILEANGIVFDAQGSGRGNVGQIQKSKTALDYLRRAYKEERHIGARRALVLMLNHLSTITVDPKDASWNVGRLPFNKNSEYVQHYKYKLELRSLLQDALKDYDSTLTDGEKITRQEGIEELTHELYQTSGLIGYTSWSGIFTRLFCCPCTIPCGCCPDALISTFMECGPSDHKNK